MRVVCVIPARIGSTRLPEKPLTPIAGEPLVRRMARRVVDADFADDVVVATDDERVVAAVRGVRVHTMLTSPHHRTGTDRVAEVMRHPRFEDAEIVVNVQGDEPFLPRDAMVGPAEAIRNGNVLATSACPLEGQEIDDPNTVKVTIGPDGMARRFSRSRPEPALLPATFRHLGVYAYRRAELMAWADSPVVAEDTAQRLEQLRPLRTGGSFYITMLMEPIPHGIDTPADLTVARRLTDQVILEHANA